MGLSGNSGIDKLTLTNSQVSSSSSYSPPSTVGSNLAVGSDGNIWFAEPSADKIAKVTPSGTFTEYGLQTGNSPYAVTAGADGAIWFTNYDSNSIGRITTLGSNITSYAIPTSGSHSASIVSGADGAIWFGEASKGKIGRLGY